MAQTRRQTQAIGGDGGTEFRAPEDSDVSQLTLYCGERLNGIEVTYSNGNVQKIGNTNGDFRSLNAAADPIKTVFVYTDQQSSKVLGIRVEQRSRTVSVFGSESEYTRSFSLPRENRLVAISGRHQADCVVAITFIYLASSNAFEPPAHGPGRNESQETRNVDPGDTARQTQSTGRRDFDRKSAAILGTSVAAIFVTGLAINTAAKIAWRRMTKPGSSASDSSDDEDSRCRNPY